MPPSTRVQSKIACGEPSFASSAAAPLTRRNHPNDKASREVNAPLSSRRTASPVRLSLAAVLGGAIGGAWWPRTGSMVRELPELIEALRPALGEVLDISINWSAGSATPVMSSVPAAATAKAGWASARQRLMAFGGRTAGTRLLVVPAMTPTALALMVLRHAGNRQISDADRATPAFEKAERILNAARADSSAWVASAQDGEG